jgi:hypothetical protein
MFVVAMVLAILLHDAWRRHGGTAVQLDAPKAEMADG